jgi:geranyl-CoA carboxylase alpha subunit
VPPGITHLAIDSRTFVLRNELAKSSPGEEPSSGGRVTALMHGVLLEVLVRPGDRVTRGTRVAVLEAMKMQHDILAPVDGEIIAVDVTAGMQVAADDLLIAIRVDDGAAVAT